MSLDKLLKFINEWMSFEKLTSSVGKNLKTSMLLILTITFTFKIGNFFSLKTKKSVSYSYLWGKNK